MGSAPSATTTAILSLAIGFGGVAALVSAYDAFVLRPLPVPEPDRLVAIEELRPDGRALGLSLDGARSLGEESETLGAVSVGRVQSMTLREGAESEGPPAVVPVGQVTADWAAVVAAVPAAGRFFSAAEETAAEGELSLAFLKKFINYARARCGPRLSKASSSIT